MSAQVSERAIRGATQISGNSNGIPHVRGLAHALRGHHYAYESSVSFSQELPVESHIKDGVGIHNRTFITMHHLETYYLNQEDRGLSPTPGMGPIYAAPLYLQRWHGIGNFFCSLFRFVRPLLWTVRLRGGKIITDIAKNKSPDVRTEDIISKHVGDASQNPQVI